MKRALAFVAAITVAGTVVAAGSASATGRGDTLRVTKECSEYDGTVGSFCTITSSNLRAIEPGMRVVYLAPLSPDGHLDSDVVLSSGHGGGALGHVVLDLSTRQGRVTFSAGTGRFAGFHARARVTFDAETGLWQWDGTYSFRRGHHH
jgi:hypothetical protein